MCIPSIGMGWESSHARYKDLGLLWDGWVGKFDLPNRSYGRVTHLAINEHSLPNGGLLTYGTNVKRMFIFANH